ncbi:MAG TPA: nickel-binding protein [Patescibacteria group bacterium]|nr:nickel-binding protein [Patescibacteria group bacterium]
MALFIGLHTMGEGMTEDMARQSWESYKAACAKLGLSPQHAHISTQQGKAFCITEADSADSVQKAHDEAKVPIDEVMEVKDLT